MLTSVLYSALLFLKCRFRERKAFLGMTDQFSNWNCMALFARFPTSLNLFYSQCFVWCEVRVTALLKWGSLVPELSCYPALLANSQMHQNGHDGRSRRSSGGGAGPQMHYWWSSGKWTRGLTNQTRQSWLLPLATFKTYLNHEKLVTKNFSCFSFVSVSRLL